MFSKENIHINKFQRVSKMIPKVLRMPKEFTSNETTSSIVHGFTMSDFWFESIWMYCAKEQTNMVSSLRHKINSWQLFFMANNAITIEKLHSIVLTGTLFEIYFLKSVKSNNFRTTENLKHCNLRFANNSKYLLQILGGAVCLDRFGALQI